MRTGYHIASTESDGNGGGPYNLTKNLAMLGCGFPLTGIGLIGRDADGETILRDCAAHGIDSGAIQQTAAAPTSYTDGTPITNTWTKLTNSTIMVSPFTIQDPAATNYPQRFYRFSNP